jgi:hypothetical protein
MTYYDAQIHEHYISYISTFSKRSAAGNRTNNSEAVCICIYGRQTRCIKNACTNIRLTVARIKEARIFIIPMQLILEKLWACTGTFARFNKSYSAGSDG